MLLFDTGFIVDYFRGKSYTKDFLDKNSDQVFATSAITIYELYNGALKSDNPKSNTELVEESLDWLNNLDFDSSTARKAAEIQNQLRKEGSEINKIDYFIAATAVQNNAEVVSTDRDFGRLKGLEVRNPKKSD